MGRQLPRRTPHDESGATLIIVTLSLLAMFGMMVLVVDVGSVLSVRRALVNAADASALAAAQSCSKKEGTTAANLQAQFYADANHAGTLVVGGYPRYFPRCDAPAGLVTVRVTIDTPLFFAPVLGADSETPVTTQATAVWGGAGAGEKVAPLMVSANRLGTCEIPPPDPNAYPQGKECWFWWNNSNKGGKNSNPDLANAEWGTLDLLKWDTLPSLPDGNCNNSTPPEFSSWMLSGFPLPLPIDSDFYGAIADDTHTYVCRGQGNFGAALDNIIDDAIRQGEPLFFPVNRPDTQIDSAGNVCSPAIYASTGCAVQYYDVIGFAYMHIERLYKGNQLDAEATENCVTRLGVSPDPNARCMKTRWVEFTNSGLIPREGENFGVVPVALIA